MSLLSRLLDATIVLSFDRSGFRRHAASFRPEDLQVALCPRLGSETGRFHFDRQPRATHLLPWTREDPKDRTRLWQLCEKLTTN